MDKKYQIFISSTYKDKSKIYNTMTTLTEDGRRFITLYKLEQINKELIG